MRKILSVMFAVIMLAALLAACGSEGGDALPSEAPPAATPPAEATPAATEAPPPATEPPRDPGRELSIVCTIFPQYDWVRAILGEHIDNKELTLLQDSLIDLHSYVPTFNDITTIASSDLFIYVGGESDEWVHDALAQAVNPDMVVLNLMEALGDRLLEEQELPGPEDDHGHHHHHHDHSHGDDDDDDDATHGYDEHIWLSLKNAQILVDIIALELIELDPVNAEDYRSNSAAYQAQLAQLDEQYHEALDALENRTVLFASRFPFLYMMEDYGLDYYAAFSGCSAETAASFETIAFLARMVDEYNLSFILVTECADISIAETIISNSRDKNQQVLELNAIQSVNASDVASGVTYLEFMRRNLEVLRTALGG